MKGSFEKKYAQRMKVLEKRYSNFLALNGKVPKRNLQRDYEDSLAICEELGNYPYFLGHVNEYPEEEWKNAEFSIFVHNGLIRAHTTGDLHETISREIIHLIRSALERADLRRFFSDFGNKEIELVNFRGCHSRFNKQPDGQLRTIGRHATPTGPHPFMTVEVSVHNEDWPEMFNEAAAYLSEATGIQYHLMIFFDMKAHDFNMSIVLLERVAPPRFYQSEEERAQAFEDFAAQLPLSPEPPAKRTRGQIKTRDKFCKKGMSTEEILDASPDEIEAHYGCRIAFRVDIDRTSFDVHDDGSATYIGPEVHLPLQTATIFQGSGIEIENFPEEIPVVLDKFFFQLAWIHFWSWVNRP